MRYTIFILFILVLLQGCAWERNWDLGACARTPTGSYGRVVTIPKTSSTVWLLLVVHREDSAISGVPSMKIAVRNIGNKTIQIQGIVPSVLLQPGEIHEITTPQAEVNRIPVCSFVTKSKIAVDILSGLPEKTAISLAANSSDGP
jgi:hypothetical protein